MLSTSEKEKVMERHMLLSILDGPEIQRGEPTKKLKELYAAVPLAEAYVKKCKGILSSISFRKFIGTITLSIPGGMENMRRDIEEFRLLVDSADDMEIDNYGEGLEILFIFWDIYTVVDMSKMTVSNGKIKTKRIERM